MVVSGSAAAVERAIALAGEKGAKRAIPLSVSAPFHCALMAPAAEVMAAALEGAGMAEPAVPVIANVTAAPVADPGEVGRLLVRQVTSMVRWRESMLYLREAGTEAVVELGAGRVLAGLARRIDRDFETASIGAPAEVETFLGSI